jgi:hypothetical protein
VGGDTNGRGWLTAPPCLLPSPMVKLTTLCATSASTSAFLATSAILATSASAAAFLTASAARAASTSEATPGSSVATRASSSANSASTSGARARARAAAAAVASAAGEDVVLPPLPEVLCSRKRARGTRITAHSHPSPTGVYDQVQGGLGQGWQ